MLPQNCTIVINVHNTNTNMNIVCSFNIMYFKIKAIVLNVHNLNANYSLQF